VVDLCRHGGSDLGLVVVSREVGCWWGSASPLLAQELLEHLSVCRGSDAARLSDAADRLAKLHRPGSKVLVLSTRTREEAAATLDRKTRDSLRWRLLEQAVWLNGASGGFDAYYSLEESPSA
jgi:hypothetical protein